MHRTIAAAAIVFAFAAFALQSRTTGPLEEPLLLLLMGTMFLIVGKLFAPQRPAKEPAEAGPELAPQRESSRV